jgi:diaminopimelate epimerase
MLEVGAAEVSFICDRRAGVGADGLLRAVLAKHVDTWDGEGALWFMDYRNADGSIAEMCGNGIRVFVRFLLEQDLVSGPIVDIATRSGLRVATALPDGRLHAAPHWDPPEEFPQGVNLEFVRRLGPQQVAMRVYERGVGETRSCGTGTVAAAAVARVHDQDQTALPVTYRVDVPGGTVEVELTKDEAYLTGPAVLVAHGELTVPDRAALASQIATSTAPGTSRPSKQEPPCLSSTRSRFPERSP